MYRIINKQSGAPVIRRFRGKLMETYPSEQDAKESFLEYQEKGDADWIVPGEYIIADETYIHPRDRW